MENNKTIIVTESQLGIMLHSLGGANPKRWFRNHFVASPGHSDLPDIEKLVQAGLMAMVPSPEFCDSKALTFVVTQSGRELLLGSKVKA